ncbi:carbohydrate-binding protein [Tenacibaculum agarivorans]|uniref:carbohydrate-binding protein n=1 Tax=Tenacibaculum agarivorans TaxID=1908389 RepID=UPI00094B9652|nr:carbohydrate-binding protein [Tenacibaculum agarivorans]
MNFKVFILFVLCALPTIAQQEWSAFPVPANPGSGKTWELQPDISDDFNYTMSEGNRPTAFTDKWYPRYHNNWTGPGETLFNSAQAWSNGDKLAIQAVRVPGSNQVYCGIITNKKRIKYPVYFEVSAKIMNQTLANAFWLLSPDDTQEIDAMEGYGGGAGQEWFNHRMHLSHHVFIRNPFQDYQPKDAGSWHYSPVPWRNEYHRYGCYWRDPWHLEYYIDGKLVRTVSGKDMIDPLFYTNAVNPGDVNNDTRTGLNKEMDIIIDAENQTTWRTGPTDAELQNGSNIFWVDWMRIYKPVDDTNTNPGQFITIQAEDFTATGGTFNDTFAGGPGFGVNRAATIINYVNNGDYADYTVTVPENGTYEIVYYISSPNTGTTISFGTPNTVFNVTTVPNNGSWDNYQPLAASSTVNLNAGINTIRLKAAPQTWTWNLDKFTLKKVQNIAFRNMVKKEKTTIKDLRIIGYPNPSSRVFTILGLSKSADYKYQLVNSNGASVLSGNISANNNTIAVDGLASGMYFINISSDSNQKILKLLIKK